MINHSKLRAFLVIDSDSGEGARFDSVLNNPEKYKMTRELERVFVSLYNRRHYIPVTAYEASVIAKHKLPGELLNADPDGNPVDHDGLPIDIETDGFDPKGLCDWYADEDAPEKVSEPPSYRPVSSLGNTIKSSYSQEDIDAMPRDEFGRIIWPEQRIRDASGQVIYSDK